MRASWYRQYANRLASWGFVCVQYDDPLLKIIDDATEVRPMGARPSACHVTDGRIVPQCAWCIDGGGGGGL